MLKHVAVAVIVVIAAGAAYRTLNSSYATQRAEVVSAWERAGEPLARAERLPDATSPKLNQEFCLPAAGAKSKPHPRCGQVLKRRCDAVVVRDFLSLDDVASIGSFAEAVMRTSTGGAGGVTLADVHGGIVSAGERFANLFKIWAAVDDKSRAPNEGSAYTLEDALVYKNTVLKIRDVVWRYFFSPESASVPDVRLASPAFISLITSAPARSPNDEYWHSHVDIDQYPAFDVTTLLYLSSRNDKAKAAPGTEGAEEGVCDDGSGLPCFCGGSFLFVNASRTPKVVTVNEHVPRAGDLLMFTSGKEHPHRVEKVACGVRMAMTTAFTCAGPGPQAFDVDDQNFMSRVLARGTK